MNAIASVLLVTTVIYVKAAIEAPFSYGCTQPGDSSRFAWCNSKLPVVERLNAVMDAVPIDIWMQRMNSYP